MFKLAALVALMSLFGGAWAAGSGFTQILEDEMLIIGRDPEHFAIAMKKLNWTAISVNGDSVSLVDLECQVGEKNLSEMGEQQKALFEAVARRLLRHSSSQLIISRGQIRWASVRRIAKDNLSVGELDHTHFYIERDNMLHGIKTIFYDENFITLLYEDGSVLMQQAECFDEEQQLYFAHLVVAKHNGA